MDTIHFARSDASLTDEQNEKKLYQKHVIIINAVLFNMVLNYDDWFEVFIWFDEMSWSIFFYYDKFWNGKKCPFENGKKNPLKTLKQLFLMFMFIAKTNSKR